MVSLFLSVVVAVLFGVLWFLIGDHNRLLMQHDELEFRLHQEQKQHLRTLNDRDDDQDELKRRLEVMMDQKREIALLKDTAKSQADSIEQFQYVRELIIELHKSASPFAVKNP